MKRLITQTLMAAAIGGTVLSATPASAVSVSVNVGFPGVGFSYNSGGYCDSWGCPNQFWNYPIYYCPVYYRGRWYSGPAYYRNSGGGYQYWIHGGWRRDSWNRPRPSGACVDRYGPPLDLDFYIWNGFNVRDQWRYSWNNQRNDWWNHRQAWDRSNRGDTSWQNWVPTPQRNYDWNRQRDWNSDRDWTRSDWNRGDWERKNNIQRGTNAPPLAPVSPLGNRGPTLNKGGTISTPPQAAPAFTPPVTNNPQGNVGGRPSDGNKGGRDNQGTGGSQSGAGTPPPVKTPAFTPPVQSGAGTPPPVKTPTNTPPSANIPPANVGGPSRDGNKSGKDNQGSGGSKRETGTPPAQTTTPTPAQPATENPSGDKSKDHRKPKENKDSPTADPNSPQ